MSLAALTQNANAGTQQTLPNGDECAFDGISGYDRINFEMSSARDFSLLLRDLPAKPGVYLLKDTHGNILYVGKAASLRNRVSSYFGAPSSPTPKLKKMMAQVTDLDFILTESEQEALILENELIKRHKPRYNVQLKDDKTYPYLKVSVNEDWPQVFITRRVEDDGARYFGPYANSGSVRRTMDLVKRLFPYRSCNKTITGNDPRPCLDFYINRCVGPCIGAIAREEYLKVIDHVIMFLEGKEDRVATELKGQMEEASANLEFERAAVLRDRIRDVERVLERQKIASTLNGDQDVISLAQDGDDCCVQVFVIRGGRLHAREHFMVEGAHDEEPGRIMTSFVQQFYSSALTIPPLILLQHPLEDGEVISEWLHHKRGGKVDLRVPQRGERKRLVELVAENARQTLQQSRAKWLSSALEELQEHLNLSRIPRRMECYDISDIQGTSAVGSMVVFQEGRPKTSDYRRFQIKTVGGNDDYAMMREVLRRRFRRGRALKPPVTYLDGDLEEQPFDQALRVSVPRTGLSQSGGVRQVGQDRPLEEAKDYSSQEGDGNGASSWAVMPDLVLIDGGRGHLNAALEVMRELGLHNIPTASLAKQREEVFLPYMPEPVILPRDSQGLYLLQRIRDEAHRFAITYHRKVRSRGATRSLLDSVPGIGPARKKGLLKRFGSVKGIREAEVDEIAAVVGMTRSLARRLKERL
ncbi:MAG: uvrC [Dehalococcoidia bacterium]|nr:uvrC [Dehalococcoidia bacterium]